MVKHCVICKEKVKKEDRWVPSCQNQHSGRYCHKCLQTWVNRRKNCPECKGHCSTLIKATKKNENNSGGNLANISARRLVELQYHDGEYATELHRAIATESDITNYLEAPLLFEVQNSAGEIPLKLAIKLEQFEIATKLIKSGSPLYPLILHHLSEFFQYKYWKNNRNNFNFSDSFRFIKTVIAHPDVNLYEFDQDGNTILHLLTKTTVSSKAWGKRVLRLDNIRIIKSLLKNGASVSQINNQGDTPFHELFLLITDHEMDDDGIDLVRHFLEKQPDLYFASSENETIMSSICVSANLSWYDKLYEYHEVLQPAFQKYFKDDIDGAMSEWGVEKNYILFVNQVIRRKLSIPQDLAQYYACLEGQCNQQAFEEIIKTYHQFIKYPKRIRSSIKKCDDEPVKLANYAVLQKYKGVPKSI